MLVLGAEARAAFLDLAPLARERAVAGLYHQGRWRHLGGLSGRSNDDSYVWSDLEEMRRKIFFRR